MIPNPREFAELLTDYCLEVQPGQEILIRSTVLARPLLIELQQAILERDAWCHLRVELEGEARGFYDHAGDRHLDLYSQLAYEEVRRVDSTLGIQAPYDVYDLAGVDPDRIARVARGRSDLREVMRRKRWCSTLWPVASLADRAGMSIEQFELFVERALFLDRPDPVKAWRELSAFQDQLISRLGRRSTIRIESDDTDLELSVKGRLWVNSDGKRNMPSGEIFTGPLEASANGTIHFDVPSSPAGFDIAGVRLTFKDGEVVEATAERGEEYLHKSLATDEGARRIGELGIGTNFGIDRAIGAILFDEKIGGTMHIALGRSYPETKGRNMSAVHWDLICDLRSGGRITADGEVIQENGRFVR